ncbi:MAG: HU family DNA-binding protein, partial [Candidatus Halalkalibacterium sp. M3_1C_030]
MNDKITFQELVDAIAEQSGKSKEFAHDFIKDIASVIKESLEKDGNINIAGLGKFELKKMDEREGYNPETDESITIRAHNKIDFTPYKDLRELVNAPYSHMEPEIIEEEDADKTATAEDQEKTEEDLTDEDQSEISGEESRKGKAPWEEDMESEIEVDEDDPFGLNAKRKGKTPYSFEEKPDREKD